MSKSLKKLIDINRLREFKNKLVGTDSAYVQTGAVDQTVAGTKAFSEPIVGSVTGNAATATKATQDSDGNEIATTYSKNGHTHDDRYYTEAEVNNLLAGKANSSHTHPYIPTSASCNKNWHWSGQGGQPTWLWGGEDGTNMYVYNPSNFSVNYANSAGYATTAAMATKLQTARTITLSGAATGTATGFDGSGNITIPVTALASSAIRAQWYAAYPDGAEAHNAMWGGRDITAAFNNGTFSTNVANGTFRDIFPGDYITKSVTISGKAYTVNWVIADCDYWWYKGDTAMTAHHVVIVPRTRIFDARMNATNTTEGGYAGSAMYRNVIPACATGIVNAFGSSHILTFRDLITNAVDNNVASRGYCGWAGASAPWEVWASVQCNLMTEHMVTGAPHYSSSGIDDEITTRQMSAFRLSERLINHSRYGWWLRNIVSSAVFAFVNSYGHAGAYHASDVLGVRPFALLR